MSKNQRFPQRKDAKVRSLELFKFHSNDDESPIVYEMFQAKRSSLNPSDGRISSVLNQRSDTRFRYFLSAGRLSPLLAPENHLQVFCLCVMDTRRLIHLESFRVDKSLIFEQSLLSVFNEEFFLSTTACKEPVPRLIMSSAIGLIVDRLPSGNHRLVKGRSASYVVDLRQGINHG